MHEKRAQECHIAHPVDCEFASEVMTLWALAANDITLLPLASLV
jgi:hypothetical protein